MRKAVASVADFFLDALPVSGIEPPQCGKQRRADSDTAENRRDNRTVW